MEISVLNELYNKSIWIEVFLFFEKRSYRQKEKLKVYQSIIANNQHLDISRQVLEGKYSFKLPTKLVVNKLQTGKKKTVYLFDYQDDFLLKVINRILTEKFAGLISPACHSFQKRKGAKTAFRSLVNDPSINEKHCLKTDIQNFFNSIDVQDFIDNIPAQIKSDRLLYNLIQKLLLNRNALMPNGQVVAEQKGLMAGCPLSPFLSNIYLAGLDNCFTSQNITYSRYSDDIVLFDSLDKINEHKKTILDYLNDRNLRLNNEKTTIFYPGETSVFLGFSYCMGKVDLSPISIEKMKGKVKRLSRSYHRKIIKGKLSEEESLIKFIARLNRKLFGIDACENELCWSHWFFPVINTCESIGMLDSYIQNRLRYCVTGNFSKQNFRKLPYKKMSEYGYIPIKSAYYKFKQDYNNFQNLLVKGNYESAKN